MQTRNFKHMENIMKKTNQIKRIMGRKLSRELTLEEMEVVSGGTHTGECIPGSVPAQDDQID